MKQQFARTGAYGILTRHSGREVLLCRLSEQVREFAGHWTLPGGGMDFGEHPEETVVREVAEETGLVAKPLALLGIDSITRETDAEQFQSIRIIYSMEVLGGELKFELDGTTDCCQWHPVQAVGRLSLVSLVDVGLEIAGLISSSA
tara:strand:- start:385 stop:822 length:438 start_codon:yes stop_codon:yes gene_type:complete